MRIISFLVLFFNLVVAHSQNKTTKETFLNNLDSSGLELLSNKIFERCIETKIDSLLRLKYDYAIFDPETKCEIRYKINPLGWIKESKKDSTIVMVKNLNSEMIYRTSLIAIYSNFTQNVSTQYQGFSSKAAKEDFNADVAGQLVLEPKPPFGKGYKNMLSVTYYKEDKAMVFVFYLLNDYEQSKFDELLLNTYSIIKFKK